MVDVVKAIEQFLLPQLNEIKGEIKAIHSRIGAVDTTITSLRNEFKADLARVEQRVISLEDKIDIVKEMEQFKARLSQLEARH